MSKNTILASATGLPSRRLFLAVGSTAAVLGGLQTAAKAEHADAELIALGREFEAAWAHERKVNDTGSDDDVEAACDATGAVADRIEATPARTLEGFKVKARAVSWCHDGNFEHFGTTTDKRIAARIIRELLAV